MTLHLIWINAVVAASRLQCVKSISIFYRPVLATTGFSSSEHLVAETLCARALPRPGNNPCYPTRAGVDLESIRATQRGPGPRASGLARPRAELQPDCSARVHTTHVLLYFCPAVMRL